ncbi:hypothetical protein OG286_21430 [Kitasatospora sp. NBC_00039]
MYGERKTDGPQGSPGQVPASASSDAANPSRRREALDRAAVEAVRQGALLQSALVNHGEMVGVKYIFEQTLDHHAPIPAGYLDVVREVYAEPRADEGRPYDTGDAARDTGRTAGEAEGSLLRTSRRSWSFANAFEALRPEGSVLVLARPPASGRTITAYALLARLVDEGLVDEVWPVSFGGSRHFPARRLPREHHRGYVLELPPDEEDFEIHESFGANLETIKTTLIRRHSRLIILTSPEQWRRLSRGAPRDVAPPLDRAMPRDIAARWLRAEEPTFPVERWLADNQINDLLQGQSPTDVLRVVELMLEEHRGAQHIVAIGSPGIDALQRRRAGGEASSGLTFDQQVAKVVAARSNWEDELHDWHEEDKRTSFHRNFLVAAAALRGASVGHVYAKAADLAAQLDEPDVPLAGQQAPGVIAMTRAIDARRNRDGTLTFNRTHWDDAALEYFWNDRPLARSQFLSWLARAPLDQPKAALESIDRDDLRELAGRIGEFAVRWAVRHRRQEPLEEIVTAWHEQTKDKQLWPLAVALLDGAASQAASAPFIHTLLLSWAKRTEVSLQLAVVAVCSGEFGRRHTGKALRRLRHAAKSEHQVVVKALQAAVHTLWADPSVRPMLFTYVVEWCGLEKTRDTVGLRTFAALAATAKPGSNDIPLLLDGSDVEEEERFRPPLAGLVTGWRTLLRQGPGPAGAREVDKAAFLWLEAALMHPELKTTILNTLRQAVVAPGKEGQTLRETLRTCLYGWVQGQDRPYSADRKALQQELSSLLDADLYAVMRPKPSQVERTEPVTDGDVQPASEGAMDGRGILARDGDSAE